MNEKNQASETIKKRNVAVWAVPLAVAVVLLGAGGILWGLGLLPGLGGPAVAGEEGGLYHCPMHPTVVQDKPGDCPICGMRLVPVEEGEHEAHAAAPAGGEALYHCPMHPTVVQDKPGDCPICGMRLVPVEEEEHAGHGGGPGTGPEADVEGYASVRLNGAKQQLIGVRTGRVQRIPMRKVIRTVGVVEEDETRVRHIHTKITGWIEDLYVDFTGKEVKRGERLLSIYSPELVSTQEEYLLALRARERVSGSPFPEVASSGDSLLRSTRRRLELWDIKESEIERLEKTGEPIKNLVLYSPISGYVLHKTALEGMYVQPGKELFSITDLSEVWVHADIYEYELPLVEVGQEAALTLSYYPGEVFRGTVDYVYPYLEPATRTVKVRFRFLNPGLKLKLQMYANVRLEVDLGERLAVPEEAILDTGARQIAFLALGDGWYAPRRVQVGLKADGSYEVLGGLEEGDVVVTSGNFMIDSESRLKASIAAATQKGSEAPAPGHAGH